MQADEYRKTFTSLPQQNYLQNRANKVANLVALLKSDDLVLLLVIFGLSNQNYVKLWRAVENRATRTY